MGEIFVGCGVCGINEADKGFASGTVTFIYDHRVRVEWDYSPYRACDDEGNLVGTYPRLTYPCVEMANATDLRLMSVPDHDHWPFNSWAQFVSLP